MTNNNTSAEERYLKKLTNNVVTPGLFSKRNSKTDRGTQLPEGSTASSDTMRTPKRTVNRSPRGFRWSIEHMSVMYPADIDESAQSTICPFGDANNADVQRALDVYWEGVHNVMSPDERKRSQSTASRGYESDVASLPRTPKQNGNMATPKRSVSHVPQSSSLRTRCTFPRSSLSTPQSSSRSFEEMSADSPSNIDENSASPYCSFEDTDGDTVPHEIDQYWERSHYAMSPRVSFKVRFTMEPATRDQSQLGSNDYSHDVTEALEEAREILTQGQARKHSREHILEDATTVKVTKSGTNAEPIEVVVSRRTVVSQPNSEDEEEYGGYGSGSDGDTLIRSRTSSYIHHRHDTHFEGTATRHTNVRYRRKKGDSWQRDVGGEVDTGEEAHLEVDVKAECVENDEGSHLVKTWEARWTVQHYDLLPEWLQDNEFLRHGHRPPLPSFSECFKSIWALHTETGNIWTHLIGCVAFFFLALWFLTRPDTHIQFQEKLVFSFFFLGAIFCLGMSCTFHTVSCHSADVVRIFSKLDYVGISLLIIGSFIPWIYYGFYCRMEPKITYIGMVCVLGVAAVIVSLWDKFSESKYRPLRALVFVCMGGSGVIPALHFMWKEGSERLFDQGGFHWLLAMAGLYLLGALLYATRTPERFFPGKFDIWFQSHQLFHICVVCAALVHYYGITELAFNRLTGTCDADTGEHLAGGTVQQHLSGAVHTDF